MIIAVLCGCRDNEHDVNANEGVQLKEIIIGSDIQPPFNYVDSDGNPTGIDVELLQRHSEGWDIKQYL